MPRQVYSTRFLLGTVTFGGTAFVSYTVPADYVAVVKTWTVGKLATPAARAYLTVGPAAGNLVAVQDLPTVAITSGGILSTFITCNAGDIIRVDALAGTMFTTVSGYLLIA